MKLTIVVPLFNEAATIERVLRSLRKLPLEIEIVAVDDGSSDGSAQLVAALQAEIPELKLLRHTLNRGKGAALQTGFAAATGDVIVVQDADLEYDPRDIPSLLEPIRDGTADIVYGSRFLGGPHRVLYFRHYLANRLFTFLSNLLTDLNLSDIETGYKVFRREVLDQIQIESEGFGFEPEFTAKAARANFRIYEAPISYHGRTYAEGKKIKFRDALVTLWCIFRYNLFD